MASIVGIATVVNTSGSYRMEVLECSSGNLIIEEIFLATTNGNISHTITNNSLNVNLGSIKVRITDIQDGGQSSVSACFNHSCIIPPSITNITTTSNC
jgi:hypothetical protein